MNFYRFLLSLFLISNFACFSQNEKLIGEWHVVSVDNGQIYWNTKKDSLSTSEAFNEKYGEVTKESGNFWVADLRSQCSHNRFIFTEKGEYFQYMTENDRLLIFSGKYELVPNTNTMKLEIKGRISTSPFKREAEYYFENDLLHFKIESLCSYKKATHFILEKKNID